MAVDAQILERAKEWLGDNFDEETKRQVKNMIENDEKELVESFYKSLEFGTGGLRGIMGVGTNRMNIYTVGMATQGLANYLNQTYAGQPIKVVIAHDSRNNSQLFAKTCADIFSANGIKAYLFESLRPVPVLSFAVRQLGCNSGVMITASHNPKEYNGYKAYWNDGAQVVPPHDINIVKEAAKVKVADIKFKGNPDLIEMLGEVFDQIYLDKVKSLTLSQDDITKHKDIKIVYT
ncbi:MAG: phospho-sugar mutase, partial [Bacteroidales bacterium]|nr:phospho-sugar mutase [Bacteroidales bacterium]